MTPTLAGLGYAMLVLTLFLVSSPSVARATEHFLTVPLDAPDLFNVTEEEFYDGVIKRIQIPGATSEVLVVEESWPFFRKRPVTRRREGGSSHFVPFENARASIQEQSVQDYLEALVEAVTNSWALDRIDQAVKPLDNNYLGYAAGITDKRTVHIYVIDTGVYDHNDIPGTVTLDFDRYPNPSWDCNGHGTHVGGIIASNTYGVAPSAAHHIHAIRVLDCTGSGSSADVLAGLLYVASNLQLPAVINMSLGIKGTTSSLTTAVTNLINAGAVVVGAGGNQADAACSYFPPTVPGVIGVGALDRTSDNLDVAAYYSNYGPCIALYAPGSEVTSTLPNNLVGTKSGTSMASPFVAGAIVNALASDTSLTGPDAKNLVLGRVTMHIVTGDNVGTLRNNVLFVPPALSPPPPAPTPPNTVSTSTASTSVASTTRASTTSVASTTGRTSTTLATTAATTSIQASTTLASTVGTSTRATTSRASTSASTTARASSTRAATSAATTARTTSTASTRAASTTRTTSTAASTTGAASTRGTTTRASTTRSVTTSAARTATTSATRTTTVHAASTTSAGALISPAGVTLALLLALVFAVLL